MFFVVLYNAISYNKNRYILKECRVVIFLEAYEKRTHKPSLRTFYQHITVEKGLIKRAIWNMM